jgi:hypothetical protein
MKICLNLSEKGLIRKSSEEKFLELEDFDIFNQS